MGTMVMIWPIEQAITVCAVTQTTLISLCGHGVTLHKKKLNRDLASGRRRDGLVWDSSAG